MKKYKNFNTKEKIKYNIIRIIGIILCLFIPHFIFKLFDQNFSFISAILNVIKYPFTLFPLVNNIYGFINFLLCIILCDLVIIALIYLFSFPFISIFFSIINTKFNIIKENTKFLSENDIEYYRDLLNEVKPHEISLIMNMKLEKDKDIAANILYLKNRNIIKEIDNKLIFNENLSESDTLFKNALLNKDFNLWEKNCIKKTINNGYIKYKSNNKKIIITNIILFIIFFISMFTLKNIDNDFLNFTETENAILENEEAFQNFFNDPILIKIEIKFILAFISLLFMISSFVIPIYTIITNIILFKNKNKLVRTKKGKDLADKVLGLKNFIHDFTNLEDKKKKELILWKDYLVYAIILEENKQIIKEIKHLI